MKTYCTVKAVLQNKEGHILLLRRSSTHPTQGLRMDLPGGVIEDSEHPAESLLREIEEETGLKINMDTVQLIFACSEENEDQNAVRLVYAVCLPENQPDISLSWEHDQFKWCSVNEAIEKLDRGSYKKKALEYIESRKLLKDLQI